MRSLIYVSLFGIVMAQTRAEKPKFEVVSIKPHATKSALVGGGGARGDLFNMSGITVRGLAQYAFGTSIGNGFVEGGPAWLNFDQFDVQAKLDCSGGPVVVDSVRLAVQSLLEDRFQLKSHIETREVPIYNLVVAKGGPKIKASEDQTPPPAKTAAGTLCTTAPEPAARPALRGLARNPSDLPPHTTVAYMQTAGVMTMVANGSTISTLANALRSQAGRPVIDKTSLQGFFDYKLQFNIATTPTAPAADASDPAALLFTAVQEQLGLRLEAAKGPIQVLVIDHAEKPTEN